VENEPPVTPSWASMEDNHNKHLPDFLTFASNSYARQTDWFLRHYDTGVRNLAAVLTAESALVGLFATQKVLPPMVIAGLLIFLACVGVVLTVLAIISCKQSYRAALESIFLTAKIAWAMGFIDKVKIDVSLVSGPSPGWKDETLYPPRWSQDVLRYSTSHKFVEAKLRNRNNTLFMAKLTLIVFGLGTCGLGLVGAGWILAHRLG
jgi:hypothetical protein